VVGYSAIAAARRQWRWISDPSLPWPCLIRSAPPAPPQPAGHRPLPWPLRLRCRSRPARFIRRGRWA